MLNYRQSDRKEQVEIWISVKYRWFCLGLNAVWKRCLSVQRNVRIQPRQLTFLDISRYNITRYRAQYEGKTSLRLGSHERCPYRPQRACYGCLSWDIRRKYTAIYRERSGGTVIDGFWTDSQHKGPALKKIGPYHDVTVRWKVFYMLCDISRKNTTSESFVRYFVFLCNS